MRSGMHGWSPLGAQATEKGRATRCPDPRHGPPSARILARKQWRSSTQERMRQRAPASTQQPRGRRWSPALPRSPPPLPPSLLLWRRPPSSLLLLLLHPALHAASCLAAISRSRSSLLLFLFRSSYRI